MESPSPHWRKKLHDIIFESNTIAGKGFDVALLAAILLSTLVVMLDSVPWLHARYGDFFLATEWVFTVFFTIEYVLRLVAVRRPLKYARSFLGIVDLISILPMYLSLLFVGAQSLLVVRALRLLRIFRIFRLMHYVNEMQFLGAAIRNSLKKISIFILTVLTLVTIMGSLMHIVEHGENGFNSIPSSIYWAIVTITTVGYGDIAPVTPLGKFIASLIMLLGYGIIAVPTGIITSEMTMASRNRVEAHDVCPDCGREGHDANAVFCKFCAAKLV